MFIYKKYNYGIFKLDWTCKIILKIIYDYLDYVINDRVF